MACHRAIHGDLAATGGKTPQDVPTAMGVSGENPGEPAHLPVADGKLVPASKHRLRPRRQSNVGRDLGSKPADEAQEGSDQGWH